LKSRKCWAMTTSSPAVDTFISTQNSCKGLFSMTPFNSPLADLIRQYIDYRKSLGYRDRSLPGQLLVLDQLIADKGIGLQDLTPSFFLDIRLSYQDRPNVFNKMLLGMRGFLNYLTRCQVICFNPLTDISAYPQNAFIPFVFSLELRRPKRPSIITRFLAFTVVKLHGYALYTAISPTVLPALAPQIRDICYWVTF